MVLAKMVRHASGWVADGVRVYHVKRKTRKHHVFATKEAALAYLRARGYRKK